MCTSRVQQLGLKTDSRLQAVATSQLEDEAHVESKQS